MRNVASADIFSIVGFDESLRSTFRTLTEIIEEADGCNADLYKPPHMMEARAVHFGPGKQGKKAQQVFILIRPHRNGISLQRAASYRREGKPKEQWWMKIDAKMSDWGSLKKTLMEWSLDPKLPKRPKAAHEFGDGVALPGGLPETNRAKF